MKPLAPNTLIQNRYLIVQLIGKGGMGEVYLAVDQRLGSAVALKRTLFAEDEMLGNAFEREAKILARLRHPVLPKVSDHFAESDEQYLVMEHIAGDDLSKRLENAQRPFPVSWVLFWADQLLDALSYLHSHEPPIIHRDIKPQNLKLTDENHIVLLDFGLSKNSTGQTLLTSAGKSSGSVVGYTPHYAPMEQIRGTGTNPKSDLYALSATLYQLMTNSVPADALSRADSLLNEQPDPIKPLYEINPEVPKIVSDVILKGMEVSQDKRFGKAVDMQKALRRAFSSMQDAMSAQTVAFNFDDQAVASISVSAPATSDELGGDAFDAELPTRISQTPASSGVASVNGNADDSGNSEIPQSSVKTEVFSVGSSSWPDSKVIYEDDAESRDDKGAPDSPVVADEPAFAADATIPVIAFDNGRASDASVPPPPVAPEYFTAPNVDDGIDSYATYTPATYKASEGVNESPAKAAGVAAPAKKSSSKAAAIIGGLFAIMILAAAAVGAGWFVYSNYYASSVPESTPSPAPTLETVPTVAPTLEAAVDTGNTSNSAASPQGMEMEQSDVTGSPATLPDANGQASNTSRPSVVSRKTPARTNAAQTKPTPKSKPAGERTVILQ